MFLALHAPVRGVQKELSHEVNLFSVPKKIPGVKLFFSLFLAFFVHEKADMYPVEGSYRTPPDAAEHPLGTPRTQAIILDILDEPIVLSDATRSGSLVPIEEVAEEREEVEEAREDPLPIPPPYTVRGQRCIRGRTKRSRYLPYPHRMSTRTFLGQEPGPSTDDLRRNLRKLRGNSRDYSSSEGSPELDITDQSCDVGASSDGSSGARSVGAAGLLGHSFD